MAKLLALAFVAMFCSALYVEGCCSPEPDQQKDAIKPEVVGEKCGCGAKPVGKPHPQRPQQVAQNTVQSDKKA